MLVLVGVVGYGLHRWKNNDDDDDNGGGGSSSAVDDTSASGDDRGGEIASDTDDSDSEEKTSSSSSTKGQEAGEKVSNGKFGKCKITFSPPGCQRRQWSGIYRRGSDKAWRIGFEI